MTTGKALLGVVAGMAAGALLGVLFAPQKGARTRRDIVEKGEDLAEALNETVEKKFNELMGSFTGKIMKGKLVNDMSKAEAAN
ncbi:MAG: YtxH domain-containing protein [Imperialibacter sp.]|uniref:YtxH domain-containing protein n=1 Tax=Imperialibacter sp. TaxID=2038411 RepID=UPI0032EE7B70